MIYKCEKCHFLFQPVKKPAEEQNDCYRCPDCGKFAVRVATDAERQEYEIQLKTVDAWIDDDPIEGKGVRS